MLRFYVERTYCSDCGDVKDTTSRSEHVSRGVAIHAAMDFLTEIPPSGRNPNKGIIYKSVDLVIEDVNIVGKENIWELEAQ